jgi:acetyl-CoA decarbonylase/synthase complex subunit delta
MMMHPIAVAVLKEVFNTLGGKVSGAVADPGEWMFMEV